MKIKENYLHEALKAEKNDKPGDRENVSRQRPAEHSDAANKFRPADSTKKDELKFASFLESSAKLQKPNRQREDSGDERHDDQKKDAKRETRDKDSAEKTTGDNQKTENRESAGGQTGGGQSGFNMNGQVVGVNLNENFAARSILHIADLERLVSTVRTQTNLGGKREITLQLKNSVLEGLQVKISTGEDAKVQIEFLAANENVRAQVEKHSQELAEILRGRGVNLETLKTSVGSDSRDDNSADGGKPISIERKQPAGTPEADYSDENTFDTPQPEDGKIYNA